MGEGGQEREHPDRLRGRRSPSLGPRRPTFPSATAFPWGRRLPPARGPPVPQFNACCHPGRAARTQIRQSMLCLLDPGFAPGWTSSGDHATRPQLRRQLTCSGERLVRALGPRHQPAEALLDHFLDVLLLDVRMAARDVVLLADREDLADRGRRPSDGCTGAGSRGSAKDRLRR